MKPPSTQLLRAFNSFRWTDKCSVSCAYTATTGRSLHLDRPPLFCNKLVHLSSKSKGIHTSPYFYASGIPKSNDRGPVSNEDTQTDFSTLNVLGGAPTPTTSIDACLPDGFLFDSGLRITGGSGCMLVGGEAFSWKPWKGRNGRLMNTKGQWECADEAWGVLDLVWPKPGRLSLDLSLERAMLIGCI